MEWVDAIKSFVQGIEVVVDYCYLIVLEEFLSGYKEELTQDSLVNALMLTGHILT